MERLTERFSNGQGACKKCGENCEYENICSDEHFANCQYMNDVINKLADYEDLEVTMTLNELNKELDKYI